MASTKKNFLYNSAYRMLTMCLPLITTPYISRVLGAEGIGIYSYSHTIVHYFMIFIMMGIDTYGSRKIAQTRENRESLSQTFWSIYAMQIITGCLVILVYSGYCILIADNKRIAVVMGGFLLSSCLDINWLYSGTERFRFMALRNTAVKLISVLCIFVFVQNDKDIFWYCMINSVSAVLAQIALWIDNRNIINWCKPSICDIIPHIKPNLCLFVTVIAVSLFKYMDKIMLGMISGMEELGFYEAAEKVTYIPISFVMALGTVVLPRMSNIIAKEHKYDERLIFGSILVSMFISTSCSFGIMGISKELIPLYYGKGYETCVNLYLVLLPSCLFLAFANVVRMQYLLPMQMDKVYIGSAIVGAIVNLTLNLILIPCFGSVGAAIGTLFAEFAVCLYQIIPIRGRIPIVKYVKESIPFLVSGLLMFSVLFVIKLSFSPIISLVLKVVMGVVLYSSTFLIQIIVFPRHYEDIRYMLCSVIVSKIRSGI